MRCELYDLESDVSEVVDLAEVYPAKRDELRGILHSWRESVNARIPRRKENWRP